MQPRWRRPPQPRRQLRRRAGRQHAPSHQDDSRLVQAGNTAAMAAATGAATAVTPTRRAAILPSHRNGRRLQLYPARRAMQPRHCRAGTALQL